MFKKNKKVSEQPQQHEHPAQQQQPDQQRVFNFTMGNVQNSIATLFDDQFNSLQVYEYLLPKDLMPGQIITINFKRNRKLEQQRKSALDKIHKRIMKEQQFTKSSSILKEG